MFMILLILFQFYKLLATVSTFSKQSINFAVALVGVPKTHMMFKILHVLFRLYDLLGTIIIYIQQIVYQQSERGCCGTCIVKYHVEFRIQSQNKNHCRCFSMSFKSILVYLIKRSQCVKFLPAVFSGISIIWYISTHNYGYCLYEGCFSKFKIVGPDMQ